MKIDTNALNLNPSVDQTVQASQSAVKGHHGGHHHGGGAGDKVQLSDLAAQLSMQISAQASAADPSKLAQLQASYEAGTYNVSPHQIAASIIHEMTA
jgi:flagellar biosynthesis anti-sigma factor FlgM